MSFLLNSTFGLFSGGGGGGGATVTGANNGLSLDGTDVVLGNNVLGVAGPAALLSNREIATNGFLINLHSFGAPDNITSIAAGGITFYPDATGSYSDITGSGMSFHDVPGSSVSSLSPSALSIVTGTNASNTNALRILFTTASVGESTQMSFSGIQFTRTASGNSAITNVGGVTQVLNNANTAVFSLSQAGALTIASRLTLLGNIPANDRSISNTSTTMSFLDNTNTAFATFGLQIATLGATATSGLTLFDGTPSRNITFANNLGALVILDASLVQMASFTQSTITISSITVSNNVRMITATAAFANGAGALAGTLNNAPVAGSPTKWIAILDSGVTRYIPAW